MSTTKKVIVGIVAVVVGAVVLAMALTQGLADVASSQLKALRDGDMIRAYSYTSRDFRNSTSLEKFQQFVDSYPSLKNNLSVAYDSRETNNGVGTLKGTLKSNDGGTTPIEYKLVNENDEWKILSIRLNPTGAGIRREEAAQTVVQPSDRSTIHDILISDLADGNGYVDTSKPSLNKQSPKIFATVQVGDAQANSQVRTELLYVPSGGKIGPITNDITKPGNVLKAFSFTNTKDVWPAGEFRVTATLSNGATKTVSFQVR
jgi:hypothetical protein